MSFCCCFSSSSTPVQPLLPQQPSINGVLPPAEKTAAAAPKLLVPPPQPPEMKVHPNYGAAASEKIEIDPPADKRGNAAAEIASGALNVVVPFQKGSANPSQLFSPPYPKKTSKLAPPPSPAMKPQQSPVKVRKPPRHSSSRSLHGRVYEITHWVIIPRNGESSTRYQTSSLKGTGLDLDD